MPCVSHPAPSFARSCALLCALIAAAVAAPAARGQGERGYKIKLHRPEKVGDTYTISATGDSKSVLTIDAGAGAPKKQESAFTVSLDGTVQVLEVNPSGIATRLSFTVAKCLRDDKPLFDKGTVIVAGNPKGQKLFTINGEPVPADAADALGLILQPHGPGQTDDDTVFGTEKPQKVGGTWPITTEAAADRLAKDAGLEVKKEDITGAVKLAAVKQEAGKEALQVEIDMNVANARGGRPDGGQKIDHADYEFHMSGLFPADPKAKLLGQNLAMKAKFHATVQGRDGKEVSLNVSAEQNARMTFGEGK